MATPEDSPGEAGGLGSHRLGEREYLSQIPQFAEDEGLQHVPPLIQEGDSPGPPARNGPLHPAQAVLPREGDSGPQREGKGDPKHLESFRSTYPSQGPVFPASPATEAKDGRLVGAI
jgi:hypothetical protein